MFEIFWYKWNHDWPVGIDGGALLKQIEGDIDRRQNDDQANI
jgi:hypothetical protein